MSRDVIGAVAKKILASQFVAEELSILWHLGEPLTVPISYYREAMDILECYAPRHSRLTQCFQTNATLLTDDWSLFFQERNVELGVSLDGPKFIHDRNRVTRRSGGTFDRVMEGLSLLKRHHVPFHIITVLSRYSLQHPAELFEFFESHNVRRIHFNIEEIEGVHTQSSALLADVEAEFRNFFATYLNLIMEHGSLQSVREIHDTLQLLCGSSLPVSNRLVELPACVSVAWNGDVSFFSPELLGMRHAHYGDFCFGNILRSSFDDIVTSAGSTQVARDIAIGVGECERTCPYFSLCGGGSPSNKLWEAGTFAASETLYCRFMTKALLDLAFDHLQTIKSS